MRFAVANEHGAVLHFEDAVILDGDFEDGGRFLQVSGLCMHLWV